MNQEAHIAVLHQQQAENNRRFEHVEALQSTCAQNILALTNQIITLTSVVNILAKFAWGSVAAILLAVLGAVLKLIFR